MDANAALATAKETTDWLSTAGGWAMFLIAGVVCVFLVKHILSLNKKLDDKEDACRKELSEQGLAFRKELSERETTYRTEMDKLSKDTQGKLEEKDEKLFGLLDKTNDMLAAIQRLTPR